MIVTDLANSTMVPRESLLLFHNSSDISVTPSTTMRWMTLGGIDSAVLVEVNVNVTIVLMSD
jgi:hypothetical protein